MRTLTAGLFCSVDGVVESPNLWQFDSFDEELGQELTSMMDRVDTVLLGRIGYQEWASYWPEVGDSDPFGNFINPVPKYVASRSLTGELDWNNAHLIEGALEDFVADLKQSDGGEISVVGSISIVRQLLFAGLLDSLTLMVHPVVAGTGRRLFNDGDPLTRLALQTGRTTSAGNAILTYGLRAT